MSVDGKQAYQQWQDELDDLTRAMSTRAAEHDRDASFPFENIDLLQQKALLALTVPQHVGGRGAGLKEASRVIAAVAYAEPSTALVLVMQYLFHQRLSEDTHWPDTVKQQLQRDAVQHGALVNWLRVEPELGSPARGGLPATTAYRDGDGWRLSGHKIYSTGCVALKWLAVWGRTDEVNPRVGVFLVPRETAGVHIEETWDHLGMRATASHDVLLTDVRIPLALGVDLRTPEEWGQQKFAGGQDAWMVVLLSTLYHSVARAARDWLVDYLPRRVPSNLGKPLSELPRFQQAVGEIDSLLFSSQVLLDSVITRTEAGQPPAGAEVHQVKYWVSRQAIEAVEKAVALVGNPALSRRYPLERHYRNVLCSRIHTPQDDATLAQLGKLAFGPG